MFMGKEGEQWGRLMKTAQPGLGCSLCPMTLEQSPSPGLPWGFLPIKQEHEAPLMAWRRWCLASLCFAAGRWPAALWRREGNLPNQTCGCLGLLGQPPAPSEIQGMSFPWRVRVKKNRSLLTSHASSAPAWQAQPLAQEADTPSPCCQGTATSASPWKSPLP